MDSKRKHFIPLLTLLVLFETAEAMGICKFGHMFPFKGCENCFQRKTPSRDQASCSTSNLPTVLDGSFDCPSNVNVSEGEACTLTCNDGFYPAFSSRTVCEAGSVNTSGEWSAENFTCRAPTCQKIDLPAVTAGFFNCSGYSVGDKCNLTCDDGYYPSASNETVCEESDDLKGNWTNGIYQCSLITCSEDDLPHVVNGSFLCPSSTLHVGDACKLTACTDAGVYTFPFNRTVCRATKSGNGGEWYPRNFSCRPFECGQWHGWNEREYKHFNTKRTWEGSCQICKTRGGQFIKIEDEEHNDFLQKLIFHCDRGENVWIGLNDLDNKDIWTWNDGTNATYVNFGSNLRSDDCIRIDRLSGRWFDEHCNITNNVLCEK